MPLDLLEVVWHRRALLDVVGERCVDEKGRLVSIFASTLDVAGIGPGGPEDSPAPEFRKRSELTD